MPNEVQESNSQMPTFVTYSFLTFHHVIKNYKIIILRITTKGYSKPMKESTASVMT